MHFPTRLALAVASALLVVAGPGLGAGQPDPAVPAAAGAPLPPVVTMGTEQIRTLEVQVESVLAEARKQQAQMAQMRERLADAEASNAWLPWLAGCLLLSLAAVAGLAWWVTRLKQGLATRLQAPTTAGSLQAAPASDLSDFAAPAGMVSDRPFLAPVSSPAVMATATQPAMAIAASRGAGEMAVTPLRAVSEFSLGSGVPPRPVSVEELFDLDQQVDFFLALGQEQSAIDLLLSHVRATGGTSALPYFKLLEIYRRHGDEEAYERTRERFNQRFNAFAPDWSGELAAGRMLEDYADVMLRLQRAWPQPMRAVAELESLLLRRSDLEPFDMPAYRDVLLLHALVRDLPAAPVLGAAVASAPPVLPGMALAPSASPAGPITRPAVLPIEEALAPPPARLGQDVDLLLPLDDGPSDITDITAPRPHVSERSTAQAMLAEWVFTRAASPRAPIEVEAQGLMDRPAGIASRPARLDLDLSDYAPAPREFTRPAAFTDIDMRRDRRLSDLGGLDDLDSGSAPLPSRR